MVDRFAAWVSDIKAGFDATWQHRRIAQFVLFAAHVRSASARRVLAGMPCSTSKPGSLIATEWIYDKIQNSLEEHTECRTSGRKRQSAGLRGNIMRTPGQRQQNFALECLMNEAAAAANDDPIEFRIRAHDGRAHASTFSTRRRKRQNGSRDHRHIAMRDKTGSVR